MKGVGARTVGKGTTLSREGTKTVLTPGPDDVIVIIQMKDQLHLIANGKDKLILSPIESKSLEIKGDAARVFSDKSVSLAIKGLQTAVQKVSEPAKAKIAHAKQRSSALRGIVQQQRLAAEMNKDPLLTKISDQLFRIAHFYGGNPYRPGTPRSPQDLLQMMSEVARTLEFQMMLGPSKATESTPSTEPLSELLPGLLRTLNNIVQEIKTGKSTDTNVLCSQLTDALRQMLPWPLADPGNISLERRLLPPGFDVKTAVEKSDEWNLAFSQKHLSKLRALIRDDTSLAIALPEEKSVLLKWLSQNILSGVEDEEGGNDGHRINRILQSASSANEYGIVLSNAGFQQVQKAIGTFGEKEVTDFNVTAGAFHTAKYATNQGQAQLAMNALEKGYSSKQINRARQAMQETRWHVGRTNDDIIRIIEKPLNMLVSTVSEKADMLKQLSDGSPNKRSSRACIGLLQSTKDKEEFDAILQVAVIDVGNKLQDQEARKKWSLLAGAYDRPDLALQSDLSKVTLRVLCDSAKSNRLPADLAPAKQPSPSSTGAEDYPAQNRNRVMTRIVNPGRLSITEAILLNAEREKEGKPMLRLLELRRTVDSILTESSLSEKDQRARIEEIRKQSAITEYAMRNLIADLEYVYKDAVEELNESTMAGLAALEEKVRRAEVRYGKSDSEPETVRKELEDLRATITPYHAVLRQAAAMMESLYPPPREFFEMFR